MAGVGQDTDLSSEEEVKEYLNNLGIEYRFGCYSEKNPKACQLLGEFMESISRETSKAFQVFESNCIANKFGPSCNKAGHYKIIGLGDVEADPDLGYKYLVQGCDSNFGKACFLAGMFHTLKLPQKITTEQNVRTATRMFERGCELDHATSCQFYANNLLKPGLDQNLTKAAEVFEKACNMGAYPACHNISVMYRKGDGVVQNSVLADKYMNQAQSIHEQILKEKERLKFQEGVETAGSAPLKH